MLRTLMIVLIAVSLLMVLTGCPKQEAPVAEGPEAPASEVATPAADPAAPGAEAAAAADVPGSACKVEGEEGKPIQKTDSGLQYIVLDEGTGAKPAQGDEIVAEYTGWLTDGTKFDSSADHPGEFSFPVGTGRVIPGWDEALMDMKEGERRKLIVPAELAYGPEGMGPIPANATLVFEVKLVKIKK